MWDHVGFLIHRTTACDLRSNMDIGEIVGDKSSNGGLHPLKNGFSAKYHV